MTPKIKKVWAWIGTVAASGLMVTVLLYAVDNYVKNAVAEEMKNHPTSTGFATVKEDVEVMQGEHLLINSALTDLAASSKETRESQQRFEELFIEYLGRQ